MPGEKLSEHHEASEEKNPWDELANNPPAFAGGQAKEEKPKYPYIRKEIVEHSAENYELFRGDVLDLKIGDERLTFTSLDKFNPVVISKEAKRATKLSPMMEELIGLQDHVVSDETLRRSQEEKDGVELTMKFIEHAIKGDRDLKQFCEEHKIHDIHELTPRQAIELTTEIVSLYTRYSHDKDGKPDGRRADKMTVRSILSEGRLMKDKKRYDPSSWENWGGNGVCRNFASATKFVFDTLKANQTENSMLQDTYCVFRESFEHSDYEPKYAKKEIGEKYSSGHAWNDFIQISNDGKKANMTSVDVTWAERDLETKELIGLEQTSERTRIALKKVEGLIPRTPEGDEQVSKLLSFYGSRLEESYTQARSNVQANFAHDALAVLSRRTRPKNFFRTNYEAICYITNTFFLQRTNHFSIEELDLLYAIHHDNEAVMDGLVKSFVNIEEKKPPEERFTDIVAVNQELADKIKKFRTKNKAPN